MPSPLSLTTIWTSALAANDQNFNISTFRRELKGIINQVGDRAGDHALVGADRNRAPDIRHLSVMRLPCATGT